MSIATHLFSAPMLASTSRWERPPGQGAGLTLNVDIVWATVIAGLVVVALGVLLRSRATSGVPGKFQLLWEMAVTAVQKQVDDVIGPGARGRAAGTDPVRLHLRLQRCSRCRASGARTMAPRPDQRHQPAPGHGPLRLRPGPTWRHPEPGRHGYVKHYLTGPSRRSCSRSTLFMNGVEELAKPLTLALRLFGNLFAGGLMLSLLRLVIWKSGPARSGASCSVPFTVVWKLFDMFIGVIQAFIFALLTILYYQFAVEEGGH